MNETFKLLGSFELPLMSLNILLWKCNLVNKAI